ncbi:GNAT family N-acetyltransferase [Micromonospora sicca]|uniref:GNAT family N-acetyltransferase n=1 Tax=Micromonospora sicca TaxID=2202420 RepID=UPI001F230390|nr:GNAT family N-acetyltransferase [Micromonospora sp. 4G51]
MPPRVCSRAAGRTSLGGQECPDLRIYQLASVRRRRQHLGRWRKRRRLTGYAAAQDQGPHLRSGDAHRVARLHDRYVRPDRRRHGVGRALLAAVSDRAAGWVRYLEWQAHRERAAPFYERLGHRGEPCPQPEYPTFILDFRSR